MGLGGVSVLSHNGVDAFFPWRLHRRLPTDVLLQAVAPPPPKKTKTVEMAQGKWAEILIHTDRVTKVLYIKQHVCAEFGRRTGIWCGVVC